MKIITLQDIDEALSRANSGEKAFDILLDLRLILTQGK